jgi:hypothetical protein
MYMQHPDMKQQQQMTEGAVPKFEVTASWPPRLMDAVGVGLREP